MKAILFVGHGSQLEEGNEEVRTFIKLLTPKLGKDLIIETCFLEFGSPSIMEGIDQCAKKGASHVYVIPIILLQAGHSKIHIPATIDEARDKYPFIGFTYGRPIGIHEETADILYSRLKTIGFDAKEPDEETAVLLIGRGGSDPDANSDLYKISRLLWERWNVKWVEPAFMGVTSPLVNEGVERCLKLGAKKVILLPYFLFTGILMNRMAEMLEGFKNEYPNNEFLLADYFGFHPKLQKIIKDRVEEALEGEVKMNCDTCQYRINAMEHIDHHHHHDHGHDHGHHHHHGHHHVQESR